MAAPTELTLDTLTVAALKLSGFNASAAGDTEQLLSETWIEFLKNDIWLTSNKKLESLMTEDIFVITDGTKKIICPDDFSSHIDIRLLEGTHYGVVASGASATAFNMASGEDASNATSKGHEVIVYTTVTPTTAYSSYITDITTETATVNPALAITPSSSESYIIVDDESDPLEEGNISDMPSSIERGTPSMYFPSGEIAKTSSTTKYTSRKDIYYFDKAPYRTDSIPWAVRHRYYADLMVIDLTDTSGTTAEKFIAEAKNCLHLGIMWKSYEYQSQTTEANLYRQMYENAKRDYLSIEKHGMDQSNMQTVVDY